MSNWLFRDTGVDERCIIAAEAKMGSSPIKIRVDKPSELRQHRELKVYELAGLLARFSRSGPSRLKTVVTPAGIY